MATHVGDFSEINPHLALWQSENYVSPEEVRWYAWVRACELRLGHSLDGNNSDAAKAAGTSAGYSLDEAHDAFADGVTVADYVAEVQAAKAELAPDEPECDGPPSRCTGACSGKRNNEIWDDEGFCRFCGEDGNA